MTSILDVFDACRFEIEISNAETILTRYKSDERTGQRRARIQERWRQVECLDRVDGRTIMVKERIDVVSDEPRKKVFKEMWKDTRSGKSKLQGYKEARAMGLFSHPSIRELFVQFYGWGETKDHIVLSMEYLEYGSLAKCMAASNGLPESETCCIASQVLEGLDFVHRANYVHQDIKPENLFVVALGPNWWIKIADFGISWNEDSKTSILLGGTAGYQAPEYIKSVFPPPRKTAAVDMWSLGCVVYNLLTRKEPFPVDLEYFSKDDDFCTDDLIANFSVSDECCSFIQALLKAEASDRLTCQQASKSAWIKRYREKVPDANNRQGTSTESRQRNKATYTPNGDTDPGEGERTLTVKELRDSLESSPSKDLPKSTIVRPVRTRSTAKSPLQNTLLIKPSPSKTQKLPAPPPTQPPQTVLSSHRHDTEPEPSYWSPSRKEYVCPITYCQMSSRTHEEIIRHIDQEHCFEIKYYDAPTVTLSTPPPPPQTTASSHRADTELQTITWDPKREELTCRWADCQRGKPSRGFPTLDMLLDHIKLEHLPDLFKSENQSAPTVTLFPPPLPPRKATQITQVKTSPDRVPQLPYLHSDSDITGDGAAYTGVFPQQDKYRESPLDGRDPVSFSSAGPIARAKSTPPVTAPYMISESPATPRDSTSLKAKHSETIAGRFGWALGSKLADLSRPRSAIERTPSPKPPPSSYYDSAVKRLPPDACFEDLTAAMMMDNVRDQQKQVRNKLDEINRTKEEERRDLMKEELKMMMQKLSAMQQSMSNVYNTMHENAKNPIRNIKA